jgi:hypothetical protein
LFRLWFGGAKKDLAKLQLAQNRAARLVLNWHTRSFTETFCVLKMPNHLYNLFAYTSNRHTFPTRHTTMGFFTVPKPKTDLMHRSVMYRAMSSCNALPPEVTQAKSKFSFQKTYCITAPLLCLNIKCNCAVYEYVYRNIV